MSGLAPPDQRYMLSSQTPAQQSVTNGGSQAQSAANSPHTAFQPPRAGPLHQQQRSGDNANLFTGGDNGIWAYAQTLEEREKKLEAEINNYKNRVQQLEDQHQNDLEQLKRQAEKITFLESQQQQPAATTSS
jgi:hypothetical protein